MLSNILCTLDPGWSETPAPIPLSLGARITVSGQVQGAHWACCQHGVLRMQMLVHWRLAGGEGGRIMPTFSLWWDVSVSVLLVLLLTAGLTKW